MAGRRTAPGYAPDLNPVEQVWGNLKGGELANLCLDTIDEAEEIVDQGLCRIGSETRSGLRLPPTLRPHAMNQIRAVLREGL